MNNKSNSSSKPCNFSRMVLRREDGVAGVWPVCAVEFVCSIMRSAIRAEQPRWRQPQQSNTQTMNSPTATPKQKNFRARLKDSLPDWATWVIPLVLACLTFALVSPSGPRYGSLYSPAQPVEVSPYTRSDGTAVSGYNRAEAGERARANAVNEPITRHNRQERQRYKDGRTMAWVGAIIVFWISRVYLTYD